jgi:hypothetical protein
MGSPCGEPRELRVYTPDFIAPYCTFRQLMSLHLLPHGKIEAAFNRLHAQGTDRTLPIERRQRSMLIQLLDYVETTWIDSTNWSPKDWSVYMQKVISVSHFVISNLTHHVSCVNYLMYL